MAHKEASPAVDRYSVFNTAHLFMMQQRQRDTLQLLKKHGVTSLEDMLILEVGCGSGGVLLEYLNAGALSHHLYGVDISFERLGNNRERIAHVATQQAAGQRLPYASDRFDLVLQHTVFSSILDDEIQVGVAEEMLRVVKKDTGLIVWYDFWINPSNPQTRGVRPERIRQLFPGCEITLRRVTLAPPILRRLVGLSWSLCLFLEKLRILNSHYLAVVRPYV